MVIVGDHLLNMSSALRSSSQQRFFPNCHFTPASIFHIAGQAASQSQNDDTRLSQVSSFGTSQTQDAFANGGALPDDFKLWLSRHPGLTIEEALHRYREEQKAKRRRQGPKL